MTNAGEQVLLTLRTHPKVLFKPAALQVLLIAAHIALARFFPQSTGYALIDEWGQLALHGVIVLIELTYVVIPALRWWNARFIVTNRRLEEHWGVLYKNAREIPLDRIASVTTERGILDRIFGCGTLVFHDAALQQMNTRSPLQRRAGSGDVGIRFHDIPGYSEVARVVDDARFAPRA
jgi:membrane protein YdbS with pleckstrin-like domain